MGAAMMQDSYISISLGVCDKKHIQCLYIPIKLNDLIVMLVYDNDISFKVTNSTSAVSLYNATGMGPFIIDFIGFGSGVYSGTLEVRVW